jgi:hypothetical protein
MKQSTVDGQAMLTAVKAFGPDWSVQMVPPSVVFSTSPVAVPSPLRPPVAKQSLADGQAIARNVVNPLGMVWLVQVVPPFVVAMTTPVPEPEIGVPLPPTAKHAVVEGQAMPSR